MTLKYYTLPAHLHRPLPPSDLPQESSAFLWYMLGLELCLSHTPEKGYNKHTGYNNAEGHRLKNIQPLVKLRLQVLQNTKYY